MTQHTQPKWTTWQTFTLRAFAIYLILFAIFIRNPVEEYAFGAYLSNLLHSLFIDFGHFAFKIFCHREFKGKPIGDSLLTYSGLLAFFMVAIALSAIWTIIDKGKRLPKFYIYMHVFARYYLAIILLPYAVDKLFLNQFVPNAFELLQPTGNLDPQNLMWAFMGASKGYQFFCGLLEIAAISLLLFRRTAALGALIAMAVLVNVLMLDIGYDVPVKVGAVHFILFGVLILLPDIKKLAGIFLLSQNNSLSNVPPVIENKRLRWIQYLIKVCIVGLAVISYVAGELDLQRQFTHYPYVKMMGIHKINGFNRLHLPGYPVNKDTLSWRQMAIDNFNYLDIRFNNDSVCGYAFDADTLHKTLILTDWSDTTFKCKLHYVNIKNNQWRFEGIYKTDSVSFSTTQTGIFDQPLLKGYGKIKWKWHGKGFVE